MKQTSNLGLKKPEGNDVVNIEDLNNNADILDSEFKKLNDKVTNINIPVKSINGKTGDVVISASDIKTNDNLDIETKLKNVNTKITSINIPVSSVNNKTGTIVLNATDIKANDGRSLEDIKSSTQLSITDLQNKIAAMQNSIWIV